jgi:hypothetical protein
MTTRNLQRYFFHRREYVVESRRQDFIRVHGRNIEYRWFEPSHLHHGMPSS